MGYNDRDYMRNDGAGSSSIMAGYPACRFLIIATIVCFVGQIFLTRPINSSDIERLFKRHQSATEMNGGNEVADEDISFDSIEALQDYLPPQISIVQNWFELDTNLVHQGQVWRLLTSAFVHSRTGVWHIFVNLLMLYWFGRRMEERYGSREFLTFYLLAALFASCAFVGLQLWLNERIPAIGASGAIFAVVCLYTIHHPRDEINVFFVFPIQMRFLLLMYAVFDLHPLLLKLAGTPMPTGTAHAAHLGGLLFGYLYWKFDWYLSPIANLFTRLFRVFKSNKQQSGTRKPATNQIQKNELPDSPKRYNALEKRLEAELDTILEKISLEGESSLTEKERKILKKASEHFKSNR